MADTSNNGRTPMQIQLPTRDSGIRRRSHLAADSISANFDVSQSPRLAARNAPRTPSSSTSAVASTSSSSVRSRPRGQVDALQKIRTPGHDGVFFQDKSKKGDGFQAAIPYASSYCYAGKDARSGLEMGSLRARPGGPGGVERLPSRPSPLRNILTDSHETREQRMRGRERNNRRDGHAAAASPATQPVSIPKKKKKRFQPQVPTSRPPRCDTDDLAAASAPAAAQGDDWVPLTSRREAYASGDRRPTEQRQQDQRRDGGRRDEDRWASSEKRGCGADDVAAAAPAPPPSKRTRSSAPEDDDKGCSEALAIDIGDDGDDDDELVEVAEADFKTKRKSTRSGRATVDAEKAKRALFRYPLGANERDSILITGADAERLHPGEFLNDNLVDFHLKLQFNDATESKLLESIDADQLKRDVYIFSSHFYTKFNEDHINKNAQATKDAAYDRVERWTRGVDIFSKKFIIVPIVEDLHWSLAIICHPGLIARTGADPDDTLEWPCIIFMDSLGMHQSTKVATHLRIYLELEWKRRKSEDLATSLSNKEVPLIRPKLPEQTNGCDCGLFALRYHEELVPRLLAGDIKLTRPEWRAAFNSHNFKLWFKQRDITLFRKEFRKLLDRMARRHVAHLTGTTPESSVEEADGDDGGGDDDDDAAANDRRATTATADAAQPAEAPGEGGWVPVEAPAKSAGRGGIVHDYSSDDDDDDDDKPQTATL